MNQEIKTLWLEALRSGEYVQGRGRLRCESDGVVKHDPLGVLCDLYVKSHPEAQWIPSATECYDALHGFMMWFPPEVMEWAGIEKNNPPVTVFGCDSNLAEQSDSGASFSEIAELIEAQL